MCLTNVANVSCKSEQLFPLFVTCRSLGEPSRKRCTVMTKKRFQMRERMAITPVYVVAIIEEASA